MTSQNKKRLIISAITGGLLLAPVALTLTPWAIQKSLVTKAKVQANIKLQEDYKKAENEAILANAEQKSTIEQKTQQLATLEAEYNAIEDKKSEEAVKKAKEISDLKKELKKLNTEYQSAIDEAVFPFLEKLAEEGDASINNENFKNTAKYVVLSYENYKKSLSEFNKTVDINYPSKEDIKKINEFYQSWIDKFEKINKNNLNVTLTAWVSGLKYDWSIAQTTYAAEGRLLGAWYEWGPAYAFPVNAFYKTINRIKGPRATKVLANLKEGLNSNVVLSKVVIKNNVNSFLFADYKKELLDFAKGTEDSKSVVDIINSSTTVAEETKEFHKFYVTEYYSASKHGVGENLEELKVYKANSINEVENTLEIFDQTSNSVVSVYGLGLTQKDLEAKNVGLAHMPGSEETTDGKKIYSSILKFSTTSNDSAQDVFESGYTTSKTAANNMTLTAKAVAKLITGSETGVWAPTVKYDEDGLGKGEIVDLKLNIRDEEGNINLVDFNKWMNQEEFFFGREDSSYYSDAKKQELLSDPKLADAIKNLKELGYEFLKDSTESYGSITNQQFYYGALEAFKGYGQFRETTMDEGFSYFPNQVPRYGLTTYEYGARSSSGVGAYNSSRNVEKDGFGAFIFNADPYYSLPKWSVTSFANHEGVMGHHNQIYYAEQFLKKEAGLTIGNIFNYTSYKEGWALFMEWFGIEAGWYGTPDFENEDYYALPSSFKTSKGITSFVTATEASNVTEEQVKAIQELHGGVYWKLAANGAEITEENKKAHTLKAVELANMLQYYGALNEAQLRNMRRAVDTAYHGDIQGQEDLPAGASIQDVRNFLKANSALGIGDITSESKRYLNLPGQSTSYNSGKEAMLKLYDRVRKSKGLTREQFVSDKENIKEFLNLLLETGALPLETLKEIVELHYGL
ncbi:DUF885 family protein [Metamycoplasma gateae]|uniref:DUF885 family protein n=1 Tax=Metamycoplasma gateae TaxID=35769 RepID=A0ABZ2AHS4_9BACT|nr:DUF885 family protein [Metamycoplasma gateae]